MKTELYKDNKGEWRWQVTGRNGKIIGASSESFKRKGKAIQNIALLNVAFFHFTRILAAEGK